MRQIFAALLCAALLAAPAWGQPIEPPGVTVSGAPINRSTLNSAAVITTGGAFQTVLTSNLGTTIQRQALTIENNNASDSCWVYIGSGSATEGKSILLLAGGSYTRYWPFIPSDAIQATCATTSDTLYVDVQ
jgi:hypothetical protein